MGAIPTGSPRLDDLTSDSTPPAPGVPDTTPCPLPTAPAPFPMPLPWCPPGHLMPASEAGHGTDGRSVVAHRVAEKEVQLLRRACRSSDVATAVREAFRGHAHFVSDMLTINQAAAEQYSDAAMSRALKLHAAGKLLTYPLQDWIVVQWAVMLRMQAGQDAAQARPVRTLDRLVDEQHQADAAEHGHLNCPACGGSGHVDDALAIDARLNARLASLRREIEVLRFYGNKDCTAMADEALQAERVGTRPPARELRTRQVDLPRLYWAFAKACSAAPGGMHSPTGIGERLGVGCGTLSRMKSGDYRDVHAVVVLRMCAWAGLDPLEFLR